MASQTINYDINVNTGQASNSIGSLEADLSKLKADLSSQEIGGKRFKELTAEIQKTEQALGKAQQQVEGFTLDKKLEVADGAIKVVAGTVTGLTGAIGLMGIESEEFDKLTAQATNAIAFGMGIKDASEGVGKLAKNLSFATVKNKVFAVGQKAVNLVTMAFNAIMSANPVAIVLLSITALIGLLVALKDKFTIINDLFNVFADLARSVGEFLGLAETAEEEAARKQKERSEQRVKDIDNELKIRQAAGEDIVDLEREKQALLTSLTEEGSQERMDAEADAAAFEANLIRQAELKAEAASSRRRSRRKAERDRIKKEKEAAAAKVIADEKAETERLAQAEIDRLKTIDNIKKEFLSMIEERDQETELEKAELAEERKLAELEKLGADLETIQAVRDFYAGVKEEAAQTDAAAAKVIVDQEAADAVAAKIAEVDGKAAAEGEYIDLVGQFSGFLGQIAGENKELQIASIIIGQAANIAKIISNTTAANARALIELGPIAGAAAGVRQSISAGIGIASSVAAGAKAISQIKSAGSGGGGSGGGSLPNLGIGAAGAVPTTSPNFEVGTAPETQIGNNAIQAYVVSGDITSTQEAEAKLNSRRQISG